MRCLTIADELKDYGAECYFIISLSAGDLIKKIKSKSYKTICLPEYRFPDDFDTLREKNHIKYKNFEKNDFLNIKKVSDNFKKNSILVVDHYLLGRSWQKSVKMIFSKIVVIDDLLYSKHFCDVIIDPNIRETYNKNNHSIEYNNILTPIYSGKDYLIIRPEFDDVKAQIKKSIHIKKDLIDILIMFGGGNRKNSIDDILSALQELNQKINIHLIANQYHESDINIKQLRDSGKNIIIYNFTDEVHKIMGKCDIAFGALGATTWERYYLGIPSIVHVENNNQDRFLNYLKSKNIVFDLGNNINFEKIKKGMEYFQSNNENLYKVRLGLLSDIEKSGTKRIAQIILV